MDTVLALNNSPYYYFRPSNQRSIGYTLPFTDRIVSKIADVVIRLQRDLGLDFIPGIQLGSESDSAVRNPGKVRAMRRIAEEKGIEYVLHLPDQLVPGTYLRSGFKDRLLGIVQGNHGKSVGEFEREVCKRLDAASDLGCRFLVMHLPNGPIESKERVIGYLRGEIADSLNEHGLKMCIENINNKGNPFYGNITNLGDLVESIGPPYHICFDYGHYLVDRSNIDVGEVSAICRSTTVFHVHINDRISDKHLFLGERPGDADGNVLEEVEGAYLQYALKGVGIAGRAFVIERNRPFRYDQLKSSVELLFGSLLS